MPRFTSRALRRAFEGGGSGLVVGEAFQIWTQCVTAITGSGNTRACWLRSFHCQAGHSCRYPEVNFTAVWIPLRALIACVSTNMKAPRQRGFFERAGHEGTSNHAERERYRAGLMPTASLASSRAIQDRHACGGHRAKRSSSEPSGNRNKVV